MADEKLRVQATLDDKVSSAFKKMTASMNSDMVNTAKGFVLGQLGVDGLRQSISTLTMVAKQSIDNSLKHEEVVRKLEHATGRSAASMDAWAESIQRQTGISSYAILEQARLSLGIGRTEEFTKRALKASMDYAAFIGKDFNEVHRQAVKTLGGVAGELQDLLPSLRTASTEALKAGVAFDAMAGVASGSAADSGNSRAGRLRILAESIEDVKQGWGDFILAVTVSAGSVDPVVEGLDAYASAIKSLREEAEKLPGPIETLQELGFAPKPDQVEKDIANLKRLRAEVNGYATALKGLLNARLGGSPIGPRSSNSTNSMTFAGDQGPMPPLGPDKRLFTNPAFEAYVKSLDEAAKQNEEAARRLRIFNQEQKAMLDEFMANPTLNSTTGIGGGGRRGLRPNPNAGGFTVDTSLTDAFDEFNSKHEAWLEQQGYIYDESLEKSGQWAEAFSSTIDMAFERTLGGADAFSSQLLSIFMNIFKQALGAGGGGGGIGSILGMIASFIPGAGPAIGPMAGALFSQLGAGSSIQQVRAVERNPVRQRELQRQARRQG